MRDIFKAYQGWLVDRTGQPGHGRERQLITMDEVIFEPFVAGDENRAWYGKHLRDIWFEEIGQEFHTNQDFEELKSLNCTCLEMLLALADAVYEQCDATAPYNSVGWFWCFVANLGIRKTTGLSRTWQICEKFVQRQYDPDGVGSIFPLQHPAEDQRNVEIWYQMMAYLAENGY